MTKYKAVFRFDTLNTWQKKAVECILNELNPIVLNNKSAFSYDFFYLTVEDSNLESCKDRLNEKKEFLDQLLISGIKTYDYSLTV